MKNLRLSKTGWLILAAGVFLVILAGLGLTRSQQMKEQTTATDELSVTARRLNTIDVTDLRNRVQELQDQITLGKADLENAASRLNKSVISADVAEEFYAIAASASVNVTQFTSTAIAANSLEGIPVSQTAVTGRVTGTLAQVIDFIVAVNTSFRTGYVKSAMLSLDAPPEPDQDIEAETSASIQLIIYSYNR